MFIKITNCGWQKQQRQQRQQRQQKPCRQRNKDQTKYNTQEGSQKCKK